MGMYDTIDIKGTGNLAAICCAAGHPMTSLQTKDLGETMSTFVLWNNVLFMRSRGFTLQDGVIQDIDYTESLVLVADALEIRTVRSVRPHAEATGNISAYSSCSECMPVLTHRDLSWVATGMLEEHQPWCEFSMEFRRGVLIELQPTTLETRDKMREKWPNAIPDSDMIARRHFERIKKHRETRKGVGQ